MIDFIFASWINMYNESDLLILDSFIKCSYCSAKGKRVELTTSLFWGGEFDDQNGHQHHHDTNIIKARYKCINDHEFEIQPLNSCWCGWRQKYENFKSNF